MAIDTAVKAAAAPQRAVAPPAAPASRFNEDWLSLCLGLFVFVLSLTLLFGMDLLGWSITTSVWTDIGKALNPASKAYAGLPAAASLIGTYVFMLVILLVGIKRLGGNVKKFAGGFTVVFALSYACWILGSWAYIAATPNQRAGFKVPWSLNLTNESGFIIALLVGLFIGNFLPGVAEKIKEAIRPELYIKTAIVILGGFLGIAALNQRQLATSMMFRGICAIVEAYLIYWPLVYFISRKYFKFNREWAAPLASGISICGVSAAIATGGAIRARPVVPIMVSSLVVIFSVVELLILPFAAQHFLAGQPLVAGAWMGLAVKTDGAAVASGAIADALIRAKASTAGVNWQPGWIMGTATTVKVFIDIFIGVWAFVLAWVWSAKFERKAGGNGVSAVEIWQRFPKFVLGYVATFFLTLFVGLAVPGALAKVNAAMGEANIFRVIFFVLTFFSIGVMSNFRKLWEEGIGKLAAVYVLCLFGYIIWIGLGISWIFFHGMTPPLMK
ncbi:MAG: putative sulfate exporter family transporter [Candidatus Korobacteraceae bacterium]|jgi:uncharacterized membrane protein YadS